MLVISWHCLTLMWDHLIYII